jgi:hypothetical protein
MQPGASTYMSLPNTLKVVVLGDRGTNSLNRYPDLRLGGGKRSLLGFLDELREQWGKKRAKVNGIYCTLEFVSLGLLFNWTHFDMDESSVYLAKEVPMHAPLRLVF